MNCRFRKYDVSWSITACALCGLAIALTTLHSQMYVHLALSFVPASVCLRWKWKEKIHVVQVEPYFEQHTGVLLIVCRSLYFMFKTISEIAIWKRWQFRNDASTSIGIQRHPIPEENLNNFNTWSFLKWNRRNIVHYVGTLHPIQPSILLKITFPYSQTAFSITFEGNVWPAHIVKWLLF